MGNAAQENKRHAMNETGFTQVDNKIFDAQPYLSPAAFGVLMRVVRMIEGYRGNEEAALSNTFLQKNCRMSKNTVSKAVAELVEFGFLNQDAQQRKTAIYSLNYENIAAFDAKKLGQNLASQNLASQNLTIRFPKSDPVLSQNLGSNKENINKTYLNKTITSEAAEKPPVKKPKTLNISFDDFWNTYDKKKDTAKCEKKWSSLTDNERELIMAHIPAYVKSTPDKKYRKNPMTYLNGKCWLDEIDQPQPNQNQSQSNYQGNTNAVNQSVNSQHQQPKQSSADQYAADIARQLAEYEASQHQ